MTLIWNTKHGLDERGVSASPPIQPLRLTRWWRIYLFSGHRIFREPQRPGSNSCWAFSWVLSISHENGSIRICCWNRYQSIYLIRRIPPPPTGRSRGGSVTKFKKTITRRASERPWGGVLRILDIFMVRVEPNRFMPVSPEPYNPG